MATTNLDYDKIQTLDPPGCHLTPGGTVYGGRYDRDLFEWDDSGETSEMDQARDTLFEAMRSG